ncbi:MAG TPA: porin [Polyangiaceae bacterium]|nr:porin [Polyangiaceae bacterium]
MLRTHRFTCALACLIAPPAFAQTAPAPAAPAAEAPPPAPPGQPAPAETAPADTAPAAPMEPEATTTVPAPAPAAPEPAAPPPIGTAPATPVEATPPPADATIEPAASVGYDKGFFIEQGVNSLTIQGRVQPRYTHMEVADAPNRDSFELTRAQLYFKGTVYTKELSYKVQLDFGRGNSALKDFYFDYCVFDDMLCIRPGQFKRPFSRQQIVSDSNFELVDRSITDRAFGGSRDIGLMLHDNYEKSPTFEYAIGIFNGTGDRSTFTGSGTADTTTGDVEVTSGSFTNVPSMWRPALGLRLGYNHGGIKGYSEGDLEGGDLRFGIAGSLETHFDADNTDDSLIKGEADLVLKYAGFSINGAVYRTSQQDGEGFGDRATGDGGAHVQLGYVIAKMFQPVVRYGIVDPRHEQSNNIEEEFAAGLSIYFAGHDLKWQNDLTGLNHNSDDTTDWQFRSQAQLTF